MSRIKARKLRRQRPKKSYKICRCNPTCYKWLSARTRERHYAAADPSTLLASASENDSDYEEEALPDTGSDLESASSSPRSLPTQDNSRSGSDVESAATGSSEPEEDTQPTLSCMSEDEDLLPFFEDDDDADEDSEHSLLQIEARLAAWLGPAQEEEMFNIRNNILTEEDRDNIRAFKLKMVSNMSRRAYNHLRYAFRNKITIDSEWVILHRIALLAGIEPQPIDCCVKSCVAFTRQYIHMERCPICNEPRYSASRKPRRTFSYIPLTPRLQARFHNPDNVKSILYRHNYVFSHDIIADVFDGEWYQTLQRSLVTVDGIQRTHKYFEHKYDIALSLAVDGYLLFKRRRGGPSATPILLQNFNLPPQVRTHIEHLICLGVIPGPHQPKNFESFLAPLDDELALLADGVPTFDSLTSRHFPLHAYVLFKNGDIVATEHMLNMKGHNAVRPCRSCKIRGVRNISGRGTVYYVPLRTPDLVHQTRPSIQPDSLDPRTHAEFLDTIERLNNPFQTKKQRAEIAKESGIRGPPALRRVGSLDYAQCMPWEWMHLLLENVVPTLVDLWTGRFKGLGPGSENYEIAPHVWTQIGEETARAVHHIPAPFCRVLGNIAQDRSTFKAEGWGFWFMYLAPLLLKDRFEDSKYYDHMLLLANLMKKMIQFKLTARDVDDIESGLIRWVLLYEKYYYQYQEERLSTCTLPIHGLLHVAAGIRFCGPVWTSWTFAIERYCGILQESLRSRRSPWSNLSRHVLHVAYLSQLRAKYDLEDELTDIHRIRSDELSKRERSFDGYPMQVLLGPCNHRYQPDENLRRKVATYLRAIVGGRLDMLLANLPRTMPLWSKLRIREGGDRVQTRSSFRRSGENHRDNSFVRFDVGYGGAGMAETICINYGQLERILICELGKQKLWRHLKGSRLILTLIKPVRTNGKDASVVPTYFSTFSVDIITDIRNIKAVIGRVETRRRWGIIDRSTETSRITFRLDELEGELDEVEGEYESD